MNSPSNQVKKLLLLSTSIAFLGLTASSAKASLIFTYEAAGVQATVANLNITTEDFNSAVLGNFTTYNSAIGTYTSNPDNAGFISSADVFGGAEETPYLAIFDNSSLTLDLTTPQAYFGMWWSAGDDSNQLQIFSGSNLLATYDVNSLLAGLPSEFFGNPNTGENDIEPYAYLNFFGTDGTTFDRIVFNQTGGGGFETDNHSVSTDEQEITGTFVNRIDPVTTPESSTVLGLLSIAFWGVSRRYQKNRF
jgi:hypothetical protein